MRTLLPCLVAVVLLVACTGQTTITADPGVAPAPPTDNRTPDPSAPPASATPGAPAQTPDETPDESVDDQLVQVLVATIEIPRGTSVRELLDSPTTFLAAHVVSAPGVADSAISSISELSEFEGFVLSFAVPPGEQLTASNLRDPGVFILDEPDDEPGGAVDTDVIRLPAERAVGGLLRQGEMVRVVATMTGANGGRTSTVLIDAVEIVEVEAVLTNTATGPVASDYDISLAIGADQGDALDKADADGAVLTLAIRSPIQGEHAVTLTMSQPQAMNGTVRGGDVANVLTALEPTDSASDGVVASDVDVLAVSSTGPLDDETSMFQVLVSVSDAQLLAVITTLQNGGVSLTPS